MTYTTDHLADIKAGKVTKTNVIGLRKAINADERRSRGYSVSSTCPKRTAEEVAELEAALEKYEPRVVGGLHETGLKLLRSPRYKKRLADVRDIVDTLKSFHLVRFDRTGPDGWTNATPVYESKEGWLDAHGNVWTDNELVATVERALIGGRKRT